MHTATQQRSLDEYRQLAREIQQRRGCSWTAAVVEVKALHPEARAAFVVAGRDRRLLA